MFFYDINDEDFIQLLGALPRSPAMTRAHLLGAFDMLVTGNDPREWWNRLTLDRGEEGAAKAVAQLIISKGACGCSSTIRWKKRVLGLIKAEAAGRDVVARADDPKLARLLFDDSLEEFLTAQWELKSIVCEYYRGTQVVLEDDFSRPCFDLQDDALWNGTTGIRTFEGTCSPFDGGDLGSMAAGCCCGSWRTDGAVPAVECVFPGSPRPAADAASGGSAGGSARAGAGAGLRGLDRSRHVAPEQAVVAAMRGGRTGPAQGELGGFAAGQEHAEPAGADGAGAGRRRTTRRSWRTPRGWMPCWWTCSWTGTGSSRSASCWTWTRRTIPCTAARGRFFHSLPHLLLLAALYLLRPAVAGGAPADGGPDAADGTVEELERIVGRIRKRWPGVEIWLRGDSGFWDELLAWCEAQGVEYVLGIAQNPRLKRSWLRSWSGPGRNASGRGRRRGCSRTSATGRWTAGAASGA